MHVSSEKAIEHGAPRSSGCLLPVRSRELDETPQAAVNISSPSSEPMEVGSAKMPRMQISFRVAVMAAISGSVFLSCAAMFIPLELFTQSIHHQATSSCRGAVQVQRRLIEQLVFDNVTQVIFSEMLGSIADSIEGDILQPADRALESVYGHTLTTRKFNSSWSPCSPEGRKQVAAFAWSQIASESQKGQSAISGISLACRDGSLAGYTVDDVESAQGRVWDASAGGLSFYSRVTDLKTGRGNASLEDKGKWLLNESMAYRVQTELAKDTQEAGHLRAWSRPSRPNSSKPLFTSWTAPVGYCGNMSCFQGVLSVEVSLEGLVQTCNKLWHQLGQFVWAAEQPMSPLTPSTSSLFVVDEEGQLLAAPTVSNLSAKGLLRAAAMVAEHNARSTQDAGKRTLLNFSRMAAEADSAGHENCQMVESSGGTLPANLSDCYLLAVHYIDMDWQTRWLAVAVLPAGLFYGHPVQLDLHQDIVCQARTSGAFVLLAMTLASIAFGLVIGQIVARPLRHLFGLVSRLSELDFSKESTACLQIRQGRRRSSISDVCELQNAFCRLSRSLETFAHFVPETVVRNIVQLGDPGGTRQQVCRKEVTIMCTDIAGFTTMSESLAQRDLLFILTRYFSVMMRVLELYEGVVSEILGDGLIVFWNAPDDVADHAGKACAAALAQLQALQMLNAELHMLDLPQLSIRIGIHTGSSITGNIGSMAKMKYGCLGGTKQIAMKLEELCKYYGVNVICSGQTHAAAMGSWHFFFRKLDQVQVRSENICIHELICRNSEASETSSQGTVTVPSDSGGLVDRVLSGASAASASLACSLRLISSLICQPSTRLRERGLWSVSWLRSKDVRASNFLSKTQDIPELPDLPAIYSLAQGAAHDEATADKRLQVGLYEEALKAYHEGRLEEARRKAAALFEETGDTAAEKLMSKARRKVSL